MRHITSHHITRRNLVCAGKCSCCTIQFNRKVITAVGHREKVIFAETDRAGTSPLIGMKNTGIYLYICKYRWMGWVDERKSGVTENLVLCILTSFGVFYKYTANYDLLYCTVWHTHRHRKGHEGKTETEDRGEAETKIVFAHSMSWDVNYTHRVDRKPSRFLVHIQPGWWGAISIV